MAEVDIWLLGFKGRRREAPLDGLQRVFRIDAGTAMDVEQSIPCAVKFGVPDEHASRWVEALESIGGIVEVREGATAPAGRFSLPPPPGLGPSAARPMELHSDELELADVPPPRRRLPRSLGPMAPGAAVRPSTAEGMPRTRAWGARLARVGTGAGMVALGASLLAGAHYGLGKSCIDGTGTAFTLVLDGVGFAFVGVGAIFFLAALVFDAAGAFEVGTSAMALVLGYAAAFGLNYARSEGWGPIPRAALRSDIAPSGPEARGWLNEEGSRFDIGDIAGARRFIDAVYTAGARRVIVTSEVYDAEGRRALEVAVELPPTPPQRAVVARAYRVLLGPDTSSFAEHALSAPDGRWWYLDVSR